MTQHAISLKLLAMQWTMGILLAATLATSARAQETQPDWPTSEQLANVPASLEHSIPMARKLVAHLKNQLDVDQLGLLDRVHHYLQVMQLVDAGQLGTDRQPSTTEKTRLVEFYRWQAERSLLELLDRLSADSIIELNFRDGQPSHAPDTPIVVDPRDSLVLLRIITGNPESHSNTVRLAMDAWDLIRERAESPFSVEIFEGGTTYVLLDRKQLPLDQTTSHLIFRDADSNKPLHSYALTFQAAARGQLAIDVIDGSDQSVATLREIESEVLKSERIVESNDSMLDYWNRRTVDEAAEVRSKVASSRTRYEDLRETLHVEIDQRD